LNRRIVSLVCAGAFALIASETLLTSGAVAQITTAGGVPSAGDGGSVATVRLVAEILPAAKQDPAERSARSIECAQKADAQGLQGKTRKHFLRECKRGS
jgi:psiF repeat